MLSILGNVHFQYCHFSVIMLILGIVDRDILGNVGIGIATWRLKTLDVI